MEKSDKGFDSADVLGGTLNIFGFKIDLGELLGSPENLKGRLEELREKLKAVGGKEALSDEQWRQGDATITGHIRTRGLLGEQEYHIGTVGKPTMRGKSAPEPPEVGEPPVDVFDEGSHITIIADVPGVGLEDLELTIHERTFGLSTRATARRGYRKELHLTAEVEPASLQASCRNGVLEARVDKK